MKKKPIGIALTIILMASLFAGCGESTEENQEEMAQTSETEINQEDELVSETDADEMEVLTAKVTASEEQKTMPEEQTQGELRVEPIEEHERQMLARLEGACGSKIYTYVSVDMDKDGENEMIGVIYDDYFIWYIWYCSSDLGDCYMVSEGSYHGYDGCTIEQIEFDEERHIVVNTHDTFGTAKSYSILALHDGEIEILVNNNYGYVYMNEKNDIILDVEAYDGEYDKIYKTWSTHTWTDTYLYYEDGRYKEYGAAVLSGKDFLKYDNAQELLEEIEKENRNEEVLEIRCSYFIR